MQKPLSFTICLAAILVALFTLSQPMQSWAYTITATAGKGGKISPSGTVTVSGGASQTFFIKPYCNNTVADVMIDGASYEPPPSTITFFNVISNHSIEVVFNLSAEFLDISPVPMSAIKRAAPPNIMFLLDDSGSMDSEFLTQEWSGLFDGLRYVFDDPGDNVFSGSSYILSGSDRKKWKSQWSGYNKLYYNPAVDYRPWPTMSDAIASNPRSNPINASHTFDLTAEYLSISNPVIVDNLDLGFSMSSGWGTNAVPEDYGDNYHYINDDVGSHWAKWTPTLPAAGTYEVFAWWYTRPERRTDVSYTIYHNGITDTACCYDQQQSAGQWNSVGTFAFSGDGTEYVQINATVAGVRTYCADAVRFVPAGATAVSIKNAHYYTWDDADGDGDLDAGETYLVNFVAGAREYYQVNDGDGDDNVESDELVSIADLPASVRPKVYADDGTVIRDKTDAEDLQNFANWYSYYRRRELTATAAVANAIQGMEAVNIGFYSINKSLVQPVLSVKAGGEDYTADLLDGLYNMALVPDT